MAELNQQEVVTLQIGQPVLVITPAVFNKCLTEKHVLLLLIIHEVR